VNRYIETSALLRWLLAGAEGEGVRDLLRRAKVVYASRLAPTEARRALVRLVATGAISEAQAGAVRSRLAAACARWTLVEVSRELLERAAAPFPVEPIRTLDALHVASALAIRAEVEELIVVSTDRRVRDNAEMMGLAVAPKLD
jgi:predicted nucleic acid-binding protein